MGASSRDSRVILAAGLLLGVGILGGCTPRVIWQGRSPQHDLYAEVRSGDEGQYVVLDGDKGPTYQGIAQLGIMFSPVGGHLAYPALDNGSWYMVRDGRPGPAWEGISDPVFSPDGQHLAYAALQDSLWYVVHDSLVSTPFDSLARHGLLFSPDSRQLTYAGWRGGQLHQAIGGRPVVLPFINVGDFGFSEDSGTLAGLAFRPGEACLVVDGQERICADFLKHPAVNHDGSRMAVAVREQVGWLLWQDGLLTGPFQDIRAVEFEPGGNRLAVIIVSDVGQQMVFDGVPGPVWDEISAPVFSPAGGFLGYMAATADSQVVVVDGLVRARQLWASDLVFHPDGQEWAYLTHDEGGAAIKQGGSAWVFPLIVGGSLAFSPDGQHLGCLAGDPQKRKLFLVVDGQATDRLFAWGEYLSAVSADVAGNAAGNPSYPLIRNWVLGEMTRFLAENAP